MSLRGGGREAVEDTPVTGATEETAADHIALAIQSEIDYDPIWCRGMAREITERLESEGYVIVRAEDALTAEDRAAIGRVERIAEAWTAMRMVMDAGADPSDETKALLWNAEHAYQHGDFPKVRAIAAGGAS